MARKTHSVDMTKGSPLKHILRFAIPLIFTGLLQSFYSSADMVVVGRYAGEVALAAVGSSGAVVNLLVNVFMGFSVGVGSVVGQLVGAGDKRDVNSAVSTAMVLSLISGVMVLVIGFFLADKILILMDTPTEVLPSTRQGFYRRDFGLYTYSRC